MLNFVVTLFARYSLIVLFILGTIGLTLNTLIFTRKTFRYNSCVNYFLASTLANYFVVYFILPSRIFSDGFNFDLGSYNIFYCKFRFYVYFTAKSLASWFIVLACFDRKMSSSHDVNRRAFSQLAISRWMIAGTTFVGLLFYAHVLIFYEIDKKGTCDARPGIYRIFNDSVYLIGYSITPPLLMLFFGIWTIYNARRLRRIAPRMSRRIPPLAGRDQGLMLMLLFQVILITITTVPHAAQKLYATLTLNTAKSDVTIAADHIFAQIARAISFINHSCTFYILTLSGKLFRKELRKLFEKFLCRNNTTDQQIRIQLQMNLVVQPTLNMINHQRISTGRTKRTTT